MKNRVRFEIPDAYGHGISPYRPSNRFFTGVNRTSARCEDVIFVIPDSHNVIFHHFKPYLKLTQNPLFQTFIRSTSYEKPYYLNPF